MMRRAGRLLAYSYENYRDKSSTYTSMRRAIGASDIAEFFKRDSKTPGSPQLKMLDSGCGTGNYAVAMIRDHGFRNIHCTDFSSDMVQVAKENVQVLFINDSKLKDDLMVTYSTDNISDMPDIPTGEFDCCMNNQVVHHLRPANDFADLRAACKEWSRALKPGGKMTINFTPREVDFRGMWWAELIPRAYAEWLKRTPSTRVMKSALEDAGFTNVEFKPLYEDFLYDDALYSDPRNFLNIENFRRSDSTFNLATQEELEEAVAKVKRMVDDNTIDEWFQKREAERKSVGQTTTVFCVKSAE